MAPRPEDGGVSSLPAPTPPRVGGGGGKGAGSSPASEQHAHVPGASVPSSDSPRRPHLVRTPSVRNLLLMHFITGFIIRY